MKPTPANRNCFSSSLLLAFVRGRRRQISTRLLAASLLLLAPGCETVEKYSLTHKVWTTEDWRAWSEPAPEPKLALFNHPSRRDVLVRYEALREDATAPETRAYLLQANQDRIEVGRNPHFVNPKLTKQLEAIPVFESKAIGTAAQGVLTNGAVAAKPSRTFVLYRPEQPPQTCALPIYVAHTGTTARVALTPLAVAGDTVMVGLVASVVGCLVWLQVGAPGVGTR